MKEKIGIITFHASHNCGSILQAYALQKIIKERFNADVEIINFSNKNQRDMYAIFDKNDCFKHIIKNVTFILFYKILKTHFDDFNKYIKEYFNLSKEFYGVTEELNDIEEKYDTFICGSDQIWNIKALDFDDAYFLPSVTQKKKIAYAPSLGAKDITKYSKNPSKYKKYLSTFTSLSVREVNGKKWLQELTDKEIEIVSDPTLLLEKEDYEKISEPSGIKGDYIFYYSMTYKKDANKLVKRISKYYNMPVIMWNAKEWIIRGMVLKGIKITKHANPSIFIDLVKNAKMILTTSFHGAVFSTIFRKNFWVIRTGGMRGDDDRVYTLLSQLGLLDRFLEIDKVELKKLEQIANYDAIQGNIEKLKEKSFKYLEKNLK